MVLSSSDLRFMIKVGRKSAGLCFLLFCSCLVLLSVLFLLDEVATSWICVLASLSPSDITS